MLNVDLLEKVKSKEISSTRFYDDNWLVNGEPDIPIEIQNHENHKRFDLYCEICDAIGDGYLQGKLATTGEHNHYDELQLTQKGKEHLKNMTSPINNILKPSLAEVIVKSFIGRLIAVLLVPPFIYSFNFLFPGLSKSIWSSITMVLEYIKNSWPV